MLNRRRRQTGYLYKAAGVWYVRHHDDRMVDGLLVRKQVSSRIGLVKDCQGIRPARSRENLTAYQRTNTAAGGSQVDSGLCRAALLPFLRRSDQSKHSDWVQSEMATAFLIYQR